VELGKRDKLKLVYMSASWAQKVNAMSDAQVVAVYLRLKSEGKVT
jgi:hypothetical protein